MSGIIADHRRTGTRRENRNTPDFPDLSATIPDDRGCLRFPVFIGRESLGRSGNREIPDRLGFSRHVKTRLKAPSYRKPVRHGRSVNESTEGG